MERMGAKEKAVAIRKILKGKGWGPKEISVRSESFSMGESVNVTIKNPWIAKKAVEAIADEFKSIRRDESGEILSGGNCYVSVNYDCGAFNALYKAVEEKVAALAVGGFLVMHGMQVARLAPNSFEIIRLPENEDDVGHGMRNEWNAACASHIVIGEAAHHGRLEKAAA